ncbi:thaumatin-like protein 1a [Apium graveolens]|uniref:thaumatin-like protein 1a n=1 Tax=Apium graveolens TaxID=4045 RepID=UPI003D795273
MALQTLLALSVVALLYTGGESATFTVVNNCPDTIWPAAYADERLPSPTGFELLSKASRNIEFPDPVISGRIWARTFCTDRCVTGDCGQGKGPCNGATGVPPATLVEFTLPGGGGQDTHDISNVDGFNLPVSMEPVGTTSCRTISCPGQINEECPADLAVKGPNDITAGCRSDCEAYKKPEDCCTGEFDNSDMCKSSRSAKYFKGKCPDAYSYAYNDPESTFNCPSGTNYVVTFCP